MQVANLDIDLYQFNPVFDYSKTDIQILAEYLDTHSYKLHIQRLDSPDGWNCEFQILACYEEYHTTEIIYIEPSTLSTMTLVIHTPTLLSSSTILIASLQLPSYQLIVPSVIEKLERHEFNQRFHTQLVILPKTIYAVGYENNQIFLYNEYFSTYYQIIHSIVFFASTISTYTSHSQVVFLIEANDGYMEHHYLNVNDSMSKPRILQEHEYTNVSTSLQVNEHEYAVFDTSRSLYVLAQASPCHFPFVCNIPDRHYLYCNLYNSFRSFHQGIPFHTKINQIVFGGRLDRGTKYNFTKRRDIEMTQRYYFYSEAVSKQNIVCIQDGWIDSTIMRNYKYILDIDGNSCTWDATAWKLNSNSVIFKTESIWTQWFYDNYIAWKHYIPIADDFSDLQEKYQWCETHPTECECIVQQAKQLFQQTYRMHSVMEYNKTVIAKIIDAFGEH